jgi:putative chitinase
MCIAASVGRGGKNDRDDVRTVQLLLQMNAPQAAPALVPDGQCGPGTITAIELYQHGVVGGSDAAGVVTPEPVGTGRQGSTLRALRQGMAAGFSAARLQGIYIHAPAGTIVRFFVPLMAAMAAAGMTSPLRRSHFLAQVGHESGELRYTKEIASGTAYEGRKDLGNTQPGDGVRFKGRGLIQLTGRANYVAFGKSMNADFTEGEQPERIANEPALAVEAAVWFWQLHALNALADKDDVLTITRRVNGGTNGLDDRKRLLARAKWFLEPMVAPPAALGKVQASASEAWDLSEADAVF